MPASAAGAVREAFSDFHGHWLKMLPWPGFDLAIFSVPNSRAVELRAGGLGEEYLPAVTEVERGRRAVLVARRRSGVGQTGTKDDDSIDRPKPHTRNGRSTAMAAEGLK